MSFKRSMTKLRTEVQRAVQFAEQSAWPDPSTAADHVYATPSKTESRSPEGNGRPVAGGRETTFMKATFEALSVEMEKNPRIFVMGEGIGKRGGNFATTTGLFDLYGPVRLCDTPISERGFIGMAAGAAMTGTRPVIDFMFADFALDAVGEILNQIAKVQYMSSGRLKMPVLLRGCIGVGNSAATHHSGNYYTMFGHFPGLRVVVPSSPYDAKGLLARALNCEDPVLFLEHRGVLSIKGPVPEEPYEIEFGRAAVVREGNDVTIVALALMVHHALEGLRGSQPGRHLRGADRSAHRRAAGHHDDSEPLSRKPGVSSSLTRRSPPFGLGAEIAAQVADAGFDNLDAPIRRLNGLHTPTPYSPPLEAAVVPNPEAIVQAVRALIAE